MMEDDGGALWSMKKTIWTRGIGRFFPPLGDKFWSSWHGKCCHHYAAVGTLHVSTQGLCMAHVDCNQ
jgi:hypothetical protein